MNRASDGAEIKPVEPGQGAGERPNEEGYVPLRVIQQSLAGGGVSANYGKISPANVVAFNQMISDNDGLVTMPKYDVSGELLSLVTAQRAYEASLKAIQVEEELSGSLLDALN